MDIWSGSFALPFTGPRGRQSGSLQPGQVLARKLDDASPSKTCGTRVRYLPPLVLIRVQAVERLFNPSSWLLMLTYFQTSTRSDPSTPLTLSAGHATTMMSFRYLQEMMAYSPLLEHRIHGRAVGNAMQGPMQEPMQGPKQ